MCKVAEGMFFSKLKDSTAALFYKYVLGIGMGGGGVSVCGSARVSHIPFFPEVVSREEHHVFEGRR